MPISVGIELHKKTISNILRDFRRKGKIRKGLTWSKFLKSQIKSIYAMDLFIIFNKKQLYNILKEYIEYYYNSCRPHQGIAQAIPKGYKLKKEGKIISTPVLSGLHHHYFREAA